jgi:hypothetical protein
VIDDVIQARPDSVRRARLEGRELADSRAAVRFDTFLFASAATVLITRAYLAATGYPQVGGHSELHVAHVLWGGLLLGTAMTIMMVALGSTARFWASLIGGIGFGLFIDEIGKFLTKDVNYFFRPAVAIIYGILITAYLLGRELLSRLPMTGERTRAIVAIAIADNQLGQLSETRRTTVRTLLDAYSTDPADDALRGLLDSAPVRQRRSIEEWAVAASNLMHRTFLRAARQRWVRVLVIAILTLDVLLALADVGYLLIAKTFSDLDPSRVSPSDVANFVGSAVQVAFIGVGLILIARHHWQFGLRTIRVGLFIALMYTTMMEFEDQQFHALVDFAGHAIMFAVVGAAAEAERRGEIGSSTTAG